MSKPKLPPEFVKLCKSVMAKRPKTVIDHILRHGCRVDSLGAPRPRAWAQDFGRAPIRRKMNSVSALAGVSAISIRG